jgi:hypothetical protein
LPTSKQRNVIMQGKTYTDKVMKKAIELINKDKTR